jgi:hypothetical protein
MREQSERHGNDTSGLRKRRAERFMFTVEADGDIVFIGRRLIDEFLGVEPGAFIIRLNSGHAVQVPVRSECLHPFGKIFSDTFSASGIEGCFEVNVKFSPEEVLQRTVVGSAVVEDGIYPGFDFGQDVKKTFHMGIKGLPIISSCVGYGRGVRGDSLQRQY